MNSQPDRQSGKGDKYRPVNRKKWEDGYETIYGNDRRRQDDEQSQRPKKGLGSTNKAVKGKSDGRTDANDQRDLLEAGSGAGYEPRESLDGSNSEGRAHDGRPGQSLNRVLSEGIDRLTEAHDYIMRLPEVVRETV